LEHKKLKNLVLFLLTRARGCSSEKKLSIL
jgi:hypothetical protein